MSRPTKDELAAIMDPVADAIFCIREELTRDRVDLLPEGVVVAVATIETFAAIAARVFAETGSAKLRRAAFAEEIGARMRGKETIE
jgi:hypothetical protein